jgi:hypothetical protein
VHSKYSNRTPSVHSIDPIFKMMSDFEMANVARNAITLRFGAEFSNISTIQQVEFDKQDNVITFREPIRTFLWIASQFYGQNNNIELFKACGPKLGDDHFVLKRYLENQHCSGRRLFNDLTVGRSGTTGYRFENGQWQPGHVGSLSRYRRCYAGVIFDRIGVTPGDFNHDLYFAEIILPTVYYYPSGQ